MWKCCTGNQNLLLIIEWNHIGIWIHRSIVRWNVCWKWIEYHMILWIRLCFCTHRGRKWAIIINYIIPLICCKRNRPKLWHMPISMTLTIEASTSMTNILSRACIRWWLIFRKCVLATSETMPTVCDFIINTNLKANKKPNEMAITKTTKHQNTCTFIQIRSNIAHTKTCVAQMNAH